MNTVLPLPYRCFALIEASQGWRRIALGPAEAWIKGMIPDRAVQSVFDRLPTSPTEPDVRAALSILQGHFAIVITHSEWSVAAVDRIRSIPLVWSQGENATLFVAQEGRKLTVAAHLSASALDPDQVLSIALSGYTAGHATLYRDAHPLLPGHFLLQSGSEATVGRYHRFKPWEAGQDAGDNSAERTRLAELTLHVLREVVDTASGRPIAVPLSAGLDSRLVASGLKHLGYRNVICFAYGRRGNHEAETSRAIAERLGYPWYFVPFTNHMMANIFASADYAAYRAYSDSLTGVHFPQDYAAIRALQANGRLPQDSIIVNGQSGDFITGNHIPVSLQTGRATPATTSGRMDHIIDALIAKHFKQWQFLMRDDYLLRIRHLLRSEIEYLTEGVVPEDPSADYGLYEVSEFVDRQSKYVVNGQRLYEFLGFDWALPLWHDRYLDYWGSRSLEQKSDQRLYREMLVNENWGGVWTDIPVNAKRIRPRWLIPLRFLFKALHAPLGRDRWHRLERRAFEYMMTPLCTYAVRNWRDIYFDKRGPWTGLSPHIEDYLADHGIDLGDLAIEVKCP